MRLTDIECFVGRAMDGLSGGERQRAWIAMLVAQESECLLLDEPVSALDIAHQLEVLRLVRGVKGRCRSTKVIVDALPEASRDRAPVTNSRRSIRVVRCTAT